MRFVSVCGAIVAAAMAGTVWHEARLLALFFLMVAAGNMLSAIELQRRYVERSRA